MKERTRPQFAPQKWQARAVLPGFVLLSAFITPTLCRCYDVRLRPGVDVLGLSVTTEVSKRLIADREEIDMMLFDRLGTAINGGVVPIHTNFDHLNRGGAPAFSLTDTVLPWCR